MKRMAAAAVHGTSRVVEDPYLFLCLLLPIRIEVVRGQRSRKVALLSSLNISSGYLATVETNWRAAYEEIERLVKCCGYGRLVFVFETQDSILGC